MINPFKGLLSGFRRKSISSDLRSILVGGNTGAFTPANYRALSRVGFKNNEVVYFIISDIARSAATVNLLEEGLSRDTLELINRPQQGKPWKVWIFEQMVYRLIGGASYSFIVRTGNTVTELPIIRPDKIEPLLSTNQGLMDVLISWQLTGGLTGTLPIEDVFFSKLLDPLNDWEGWSPLEATRHNVDNRNEIARHYRDVLKNDAAPFGILKAKAPADGLASSLTQEQIDDAQTKINNKFAENRGKISVVDWDFAFERIGQTGREMDFTKTDEASARKTALSFGYPPELLGFKDGATFNNRAEAKEFLWTNTIIPHLNHVLCDLSLLIGEDLFPDLQGIPALAGLMARKREAARADFQAGIISLEEARIEGGYPEDINGTIFINPNLVPLGTDFPEINEPDQSGSSD
jgi:HK97 family phage portal protein